MIPIYVAMAAIQGLSNVANAFGSYLDQKQQYKIQEMQWQQEAQERKDDFILQKADLDQRINEITTQAGSEDLERKLQLQRESARVQIATGEAGVGGNLTERLMAGLEQAAGRDIGTVEYNRDIQVGQAIRQGITLERRARAPKLIRQKPSLGMALFRGALGIGNAAVTGYQAKNQK